MKFNKRKILGILSILREAGISPSVMVKGQKIPVIELTEAALAIPVTNSGKPQKRSASKKQKLSV